MIVKKTRDAEATRARIIEVAEEAFAEKGFAGTSIRDIARQSKCSGPLILFHFKSKEGLYTKVKEGILDRCKIKLSLEEEGKISTSVYLERMIARLFEFYRDNPNLLRLANWGRMEGDIAPWPGEVEMDEIVEKKIVEAQKNGEIRNDLEPFTIITMITGAVQIWWEYHSHITHYHEQEDTSVTDAVYLEQLLSFVLRGIAPLRRKRVLSFSELIPF